MNDRRIDRIARSLATTTPRRRLVGALAGGALGLALGRLWTVRAVDAQEAAGGLGCRDKGARCRRDRQCCSGRCKRRKCRRARGQGTCQGQNSCAGVVACNGNPDCECYVTTRGTSFCGDNLGQGCIACAKNRDCRDAGFPPGSVCAVCAGCGNTGGTICAAPCG